MLFPRGDKSAGRKAGCSLREALIPFLDMGSWCRAKSNTQVKNNGLYVNLRCKDLVGFKSFRPDLQKPRQVENAVRDI